MKTRGKGFVLTIHPKAEAFAPLSRPRPYLPISLKVLSKGKNHDTERPRLRLGLRGSGYWHLGLGYSLELGVHSGLGYSLELGVHS